MNPSARMYHCARCHCQVIVCRYCDRGNVYCANGCAEQARTASLRRAAKRFSTTRRGRHANAARQHRFRARQRAKVTHHGSATNFNFALLLLALKTRESVQQHEPGGRETAIYCHHCHRPCDPFLRRDFVRLPVRGKPRRPQ